MQTTILKSFIGSIPSCQTKSVCIRVDWIDLHLLKNHAYIEHRMFCKCRQHVQSTEQSGLRKLNTVLIVRRTF